MGKGIKHTNVGAQLTQEEFESETSHYLASGTSFPASPSEGDLLYRTDRHKWYIYNGSDWIDIVTAETRTVASDTLVFSNDTERTGTATSYTKTKEIKLNDAYDAIRVKHDSYAGGAGYGNHAIYTKIYVNGVAVGAEHINSASDTATQYNTYSDDLAAPFFKGDLVQLYYYITRSGDTGKVRNFRVYYDLQLKPKASPTSQDP